MNAAVFQRGGLAVGCAIENHRRAHNGPAHRLLSDLAAEASDVPMIGEKHAVSPLFSDLDVPFGHQRAPHLYVLIQSRAHDFSATTGHMHARRLEPLANVVLLKDIG